MLQKGLLPVEQILTHQRPLAAFPEAIDMAKAGDRSIKVALKP